MTPTLCKIPLQRVHRGSAELTCAALRTAIIGIVLSLLIACSTAPAQPTSPSDLHIPASALPTEANVLLQHATHVHRASRATDSIWGDFWPTGQGFILYYRQGPALLFSSAEPLPGGVSLAPNTYFYAAGLAQLTDSIFLRYPVGDSTVTAVALQSDAEETAGLLFHEAFHVYQGEQFRQRLDARFIDDALFQDPHMRALLEMRRQILLSALGVTGKQSATTISGELGSHLQALLTLEQALRDSFGDAAMGRLYQLELIEGSAELVGLRAQLLSHANPVRNVDLQASLVAGISERLARPRGGIHSVSDLRLYSYGTGAASVFLLSQLLPDYQSAISSELLDQHILAALGPANATQSLAEIYTTYDYPAWLDWAEHDTHRDEALTLTGFAALTPATLEIAIEVHSAAAAQALHVNFSSGTQGFSQPVQGSYMLPQPLSVSVHGLQTSLLIEGPATHLMSPQQDKPVLRLQMKLDSLPALCAHHPDGTRVLSCELDSLSFHWQGIQFEHQAATSVNQRGQHLHIDVHEH